MARYSSALHLSVVFGLLAAPALAKPAKVPKAASAPAISPPEAEHRLYDSLAAIIAQQPKQPAPPRVAAVSRAAPKAQEPTADQPLPAARQLDAMQRQRLPLSYDALAEQAKTVQMAFQAEHKLNAGIAAEIAEAKERGYGITAAWLYDRLITNSAFLTARQRLDRVEDVKRYYDLTKKGAPITVAMTLDMIVNETFKDMRAAAALQPGLPQVPEGVTAFGEISLELIEKRCRPTNIGHGLFYDTNGWYSWGPTCL